MPAVEEVLTRIDRLLRRDPEAAAHAAASEHMRALLTAMATDGNRRDDPIREVFARLGDKWSTLLLVLLKMRGYRHATLRRLVGIVSAEGDISTRIFRMRMRALERDGLVLRQVLSTNPPAVQYELTENGRGLVMQIESLLQWTRDRCDEIRRAQQAFDARAAAAEKHE